MLWYSRAFRHPDYRLQVWTATLQEEASEPRCGFSPDGGEMDACLFQTCIFSLPAPPPGPRWAHRYVGIHNTNRSLWLSRNSRWKWSSEFLLVALLHSSYVIGCFYSISIVSLTWARVSCTDSVKINQRPKLVFCKQFSFWNLQSSVCDPYFLICFHLRGSLYYK